MSTLRGRQSCDWELSVEEIPVVLQVFRPVTDVRCRLELRGLSYGQFQRLIRELSQEQNSRHGFLGSVMYEFGGRGYHEMIGIEVTEDEARRIADGTDPLDVLLLPAEGYRLTVVPDPLTERTW